MTALSVRSALCRAAGTSPEAVRCPFSTSPLPGKTNMMVDRGREGGKRGESAREVREVGTRREEARGNRYNYYNYVVCYLCTSNSGEFLPMYY